MKRCRACGRGVEGVGEFCVASLCGLIVGVEERVRLEVAPGVLLKEVLVQSARYTRSFVTAETLASECKKHPYDNVYGLLAFDQEHVEYLVSALLEPTRSRFLESMAEYGARVVIAKELEDLDARAQRECVRPGWEILQSVGTEARVLEARLLCAGAGRLADGFRAEADKLEAEYAAHRARLESKKSIDYTATCEIKLAFDQVHDTDRIVDVFKKDLQRAVKLQNDALFGSPPKRECMPEVTADELRAVMNHESARQVQRARRGDCVGAYETKDWGTTWVQVYVQKDGDCGAPNFEDMRPFPASLR